MCQKGFKLLVFVQIKFVGDAAAPLPLLHNQVAQSPPAINWRFGGTCFSHEPLLIFPTRHRAIFC